MPLAEDILIVARADHGRLLLRLQLLDPCALLEAAAARARAPAWSRGRQIVVRDEAPGHRLLGDTDRVAQALDNLVSNALRYGTVTLTARDDGKLLGLHIADQGSGFAAEMTASAFPPFSRGTKLRDPGSGLGLSVVAAIAIAHKGVATIGNLPARGANACIALPRWFPAYAPRLRGDARTLEAIGRRTAAQLQPAPAGTTLCRGDRSKAVARRRLTSNRRDVAVRRQTAGSTNLSQIPCSSR